jgi:predicted nuclease with TOPRIM domain
LLGEEERISKVLQHGEELSGAKAATRDQTKKVAEACADKEVSVQRMQQLQLQVDEKKKVSSLTNQNQRLESDNSKLETKVMEIGDRLGDSQIVQGAYESLQDEKDGLETREKEFQQRLKEKDDRIKDMSNEINRWSAEHDLEIQKTQKLQQDGATMKKILKEFTKQLDQGKDALTQICK